MGIRSLLRSCPQLTPFAKPFDPAKFRTTPTAEYSIRYTEANSVRLCHRFFRFDLIDNKLCGDWAGSTQCPEKESELYIKYADDYPDGPRTARALYEAVYRLAVLTDMYAANGDDRKSGDAHNQARSVAAQLKARFADSDYSWRAGALVYKLDEGVPVYGIDRD